MGILVGHFGPNFEDTDVIDSEGIVELSGELPIQVTDEHLGLSSVPCDDGGHVLALLGDPGLGGVCGDAGKVNAAGADMDEKEQEEVGESSHGPDLGLQEVASPQGFLVTLDECRPGADAADGSRIEVMLLEDVFDGGFADVVQAEFLVQENQRGQKIKGVRLIYPARHMIAYDVISQLRRADQINLTPLIFGDFDAADQQTSETDPNGSVAAASYDNNGNVVSTTDQDGRTVNFTYDGAGQLTSEVWIAADGNTITDSFSFVYDAAGQLLGATNSAGTYVFAYTNAGQVETVQVPFGVSLSFEYDKLGNRTSVADSFGGLITSTYNDDSLLTARTFSESLFTTMEVEMGYNRANQVTSETRLYGGSTAGTSTLAYTPAGRVIDRVCEQQQHDD